MGRLHIIDREQGDLTIAWDPARPAEVEVARTQFEAMRAKGYVAHTVAEGGRPGRLLERFDPAETRILLRPALRGGED